MKYLNKLKENEKMASKNKIELPSIICPSCNQSSKELEWNMFTSETVRNLNGDMTHPIRFYSERVEGTFFRCPKCQDELITDKNKMLRVQDGNQ